jgi:predicted methyltransferase
MRTFAILAAALTLAAPAAAEHHRGHAAKTPSAALSPAAQQALTPVIADARRDNDRARDAFRHPVETLAFFRVEPGMTVVDYMPSSGWWTRVLVPYLGTAGRYIGINPDSRTMEERMRNMFANLAGTLPAQAAQWTGVPAERIGAYNTDGLPASLNGTVDRVLIFREMHNLWRMNMMHRELTVMRRLLKDDGLLGIEQHRARADAPAAYTDASKGYLREKDVIALVEAHGFALVGKSEINANPADPANHPGGVWMLPPGLRGVADADKPRMQAIGESDRMTLLFRKRP